MQSPKKIRMTPLVSSEENHAIFNPEMLILAREFHGLTIKELADKLNVTPAFVSQLEHELKVPSEAMLEKLETELKFPKRHYFQQGRRESTPTSFYRKRVVISPIVLRQCT